MNDEQYRNMPDPGSGTGSDRNSGHGSGRGSAGGSAGNPNIDSDNGAAPLTPEEKRRLDTLWHDLSLVRERPALSASETEELLQRIEFSAGLADEKNMQASGPSSDPVGVRPDRAARSGRLPVSRRSVFLGIGLTIAAAGAMLVLLRLPSRPVMLNTLPGEQLATELPDGSSVVLNSGSELAYVDTREDGRVVTLAGEAWFDVSKTGLTFRVETANAVATVLGTQFNVRSRLVDGDPVTTVRVAEGRVLFAAPGAEADGLILHRDLSASLAGDSTTPVEQKVSVEPGAPAWTSGDLVFRDVPYHEAVEEASRRLGVSIELQARDVADRRINAAFRAPLDAAVVLEALCRPFGLKFRKAPEGYEVYRPSSERDGP